MGYGKLRREAETRREVPVVQMAEGYSLVWHLPWKREGFGCVLEAERSEPADGGSQRDPPIHTPSPANASAVSHQDLMEMWGSARCPGGSGVGLLSAFRIHPQDGTKSYPKASSSLPPCLLSYSLQPHCPSLFLLPSPVPDCPFSDLSSKYPLRAFTL